MKILMMALAMVAFAVAPVLANQCPLLIKQIQDATAGKTDDASKKANALAAEAKALHDSGKHAESVAKADEAAQAPETARLRDSLAGRALVIGVDRLD